MIQNKDKFIVDYYAEVKGAEAERLTNLLLAGGILFIAEPWPEGHYRVYVKKDAAGILKILEKGVKLDESQNDGSGVPIQSDA